MKLKFYYLNLIFVSLLIFTCQSCSSELDTKLLDAVRAGDLSEVERLLSEGANINAKSENVMTPLHFASKEGHLEVVKLLLQRGADVNAKFISKQFASLFKEYLEYRTDLGFTPLHYASKEGHLEIVKLLLEKGADINIINYVGTALHDASGSGHLEIVELLLHQGANVNTNDGGMTPLHAACEKGNLEIVMVLLEKGADVNAINKYGSTPLLMATYFGKLEIVDFLLERGANRAGAVLHTQTCWKFCKENNEMTCIDSVIFTFENKSYSHISSISILLTIECDGKEIYKKEHTTGINLAHGESGDCNMIQFTKPVWACSGSDFQYNNKKIKVYAAALSVK